jgi:hypothetical protein
VVDDMLFKWFLDLVIDERAFDATMFTKNRQRLLDHEIAHVFFAAVVTQAKLRRYMSSEHFSVDGTLLQAWASNKSFTPNEPSDGDGDGNGLKGRNAEVGFKGQKRSNTTHASTPPRLILRRCCSVSRTTRPRTRARTPKTLLPACGGWGSLRMWRRTRRTGARRSMGAPLRPWRVAADP